MLIRARVTAATASQMIAFVTWRSCGTPGMPDSPSAPGHNPSRGLEPRHSPTRPLSFRSGVLLRNDAAHNGRAGGWASPGFVDTPNRTKSAIGVSHGEEAAAAIVLAGVQGGSDQGGAGEREECQHRGA